MGGLAAWMPMYLHRYTGTGVAQASTYFGGLVIVCGALGTYVGGKLAAWWLKRSPYAYYQLIKYAFLAALPCCWLALYASDTYVILLLIGWTLALLFMPTGAIAAALVATTDEKIRSMAFAINIFMIHLLGDALSPTLVGWASDMWDLKIAVFLATLALLPGAWASAHLTKSYK